MLEYTSSVNWLVETFSMPSTTTCEYVYSGTSTLLESAVCVNTQSAVLATGDIGLTLVMATIAGLLTIALMIYVFNTD